MIVVVVALHFRSILSFQELVPWLTLTSTCSTIQLMSRCPTWRICLSITLYLERHCQEAMVITQYRLLFLCQPSLHSTSLPMKSPWCVGILGGKCLGISRDQFRCLTGCSLVAFRTLIAQVGPLWMSDHQDGDVGSAGAMVGSNSHSRGGRRAWNANHQSAVPPSSSPVGDGGGGVGASSSPNSSKRKRDKGKKKGGDVDADAGAAAVPARSRKAGDKVLRDVWSWLEPVSLL